MATLATLVVVAFTWVSIEQVNSDQALSREGQITDRYNAAVENLGNESQDVRLGGIYALQRIMQDSPRDQPAIVSIISAYIRAHSPIPKDSSHRPPGTDALAALNVLVRRDHDIDVLGEWVDLRKVNLAGAELERTDLRYLDLSGSDLTGAHLWGADLRNAQLRDTLLTEADMYSADLTNAFLSDAHLRGADLRRVNADDIAYLDNADLRGANLHGAQLFDCSLSGADLRDADLTEADLNGATMFATDFRGADMKGDDADDPTDFEVSALIEARLDHSTKLPTEVTEDPRVQKAMAQTWPKD